ncbi:MAG TPA: hypothetical protein VJR89_42430 [Polyangiales bacterium]|nr:hypothetical protein [Polyangiales bacterium]
MSKVVWVACGLALGCSLGCHEDDPSSIAPVTTQRGCYDDDQCESGELCVFRLCVPTCEAGSCPRGSACFDVGRGSACLRAEDNACVDERDCPVDADCKRGRCVSECQPDAGRDCGECSFGLCHTPAPDAGTSDAGSATCKAGASECRGNVVVRCDSSGRMREEQSCPFQCKNGACSGSCRSGEQRCSDRTRQSCDANGTWRDVETCRGNCSPSACTTTCMEGTRQCNGNVLTVCRRGQPVELQRCDYLCQAGACSGSCMPGTHQCRTNAAWTCDPTGAWSMPIECENVCLNGVCSGECSPGERRCADVGSVQVCNARGQWGASSACRGEICRDGACEAGECRPGETRCDGPTSMATCLPSGEWGESTACVDQACSDDRCSGGCVPGRARCRPGQQQPQVCSSEGLWEDQPRCEDNQACVAGMCQGVCAPGSRRCDPLDAHRTQTCTAAGEWGAGSACPEGQNCGMGGECSAAASCPKNASPDWYSPAAGSDRSLDDPRWGGALDRFINSGAPGMSSDAGGYAIVFDRASNQLAVTLRALAPDTASPQDFVYFGMRGNQAGEVAGHAVRIPLEVMPSGADPRPLMGGITAYQLASTGNGWTEQAQTPSWLQHASAWVMSPQASWAVSFRVDLGATGFDTAQPVQVGLGLHAENPDAEYNPSTPGQLMLGMPELAMSRMWPLLDLASIECTDRARVP